MLRLLCFIAFFGIVQSQVEKLEFIDLPIPDNLDALAIAKLFKDYTKTFKKDYKNLAKQTKCLGAFGENLRNIQKLKKKFTSCQFKLNQYSDLSDAEFAQKLLNFHPGANISQHQNNLWHADRSRYQELPESFDWRDNDPELVGPVKMQGECGCCWAFTICSIVHSAHYRKDGTSINPSEGQLCDCGMGSKPGCTGGDFPTAFGYVKNNGVSLEPDYPLYDDKRAVTGDVCQDSGKPNNVRIADFAFVQPAEASAMQQALVQNGPIAVAFKLGQSYRHYASGVFTSDDCLEPGLTLGWHAVVLVGYGEENGQPYWLIKNSWSEDWGLGGYQKIARGNDLCYIESTASAFAFA